jgi:hypothetical protein
MEASRFLETLMSAGSRLRRARPALVAAACTLFAGLAAGAAAPASTPAMPCAQGASAPGMDCTTHMRQAGSMSSGTMHGAQGPMMMSLLTPAEMDEHRRRMGTFKSYEECHAYIDDLHGKLAARAKARGQAAPTMPARDPCADLPRLKP